MSLLAELVNHVQQLGEPYCQILEFEKIPPQKDFEFAKSVRLMVLVFNEIKAAAPFIYVLVGDERMERVVSHVSLQEGINIPFYRSMDDAQQYITLKMESSHLQQSARSRTTRDLDQTARLNPEIAAAFRDPPPEPSVYSSASDKERFPAHGVLRLEAKDLDKTMVLIPHGELILGRRHPIGVQPGIDLALWAGFSKGISRNHAKMVLTPELELQLYDLNSTNGTALNGEELIPFRPYSLKSEDEISLGKLVITIHFQDLVENTKTYSG